MIDQMSQRIKIISADQLGNEKYANILCYPKYTKEETEKRMSELKQLGVIAVEFSGEKTVFNVPVLGKGCVGIVIAAYTETDKVALKIRRVDADRKGMEHEAKMLLKANGIGVGPRFHGLGKNFLLMEFVEGQLLPGWITGVKGRGSRVRIRKVLRQILEQCWNLDRIGLDHGELSRAPKHILIGAEDTVCLVDFETASVKRRVSNVTSMCQYLFVGSQLAKNLHRRLGEIDREDLLARLRSYKLQSTRQNFDRVLQVSKLVSRARSSFPKRSD